jgi:hypothetical protein
VASPQTETPPPLPANVEATASAARPVSDDADLESLMRARARLRAGDVAGARSELEAFRARRSSGRFDEEAEVLRIDLLAQSTPAGAGGPEARAAACAFVAAHPTSPYVRRLRALCDGPQ